MAAGVLVGIIFVRRELGEPAPIMPVDLLASPVFALSAIGALTSFLASMVLILSMPFRLQHDYGFSPGEVGAILAAWPLTTMIVAPTAGILSDRVPAGLLGGVGMAISAIALVLIAYLPPDPSQFDIAWRLALAGSGFGLFLSPNARLMIGSARASAPPPPAA